MNDDAADADPDPDSGPDGSSPPDPDPGDGATESLRLDFGDDGLVPAVAQDADTGEVLMLAYASPEAVARTRETGRAHYYSRSREELWEKGATSGHTQSVRAVRVDCDGDALVYLVEQAGGACHTGFRSCFHRTVTDVARTGAGADAGADDATADPAGLTATVAPVEDRERVFDPDDVYR
jgi:phosphoribosyl-AMP cyclohydrolase